MLHRLALAGLAALTLAAAPALAGPYDAAPQVNVAVEPGGGAAAVVHAAFDIAAPPSAVWAILTDCAGAPKHTPGVISCRVTKSGPGWEEREQKLKGPIFHPVILNLFRIDMQPTQRLAFRRTGGDWKRSDGEWRLAPLAGGRATHVTYELHFAIDAPIPATALRDGIAKSLPKSLETLRQNAIARAGGH